MKEDNVLNIIKNDFEIKEVDMNTYSPLTLAFIGDGIFDLIIRTVIVERANQTPNKLHNKKAGIVKAPTQARMGEALQDVFSEEEADIYRRGRNANSYSTAKHASVADYRKATGLEAVMGYLYLKGQTERAVELTKIGLEKLEIEI